MKENFFIYFMLIKTNIREKKKKKHKIIEKPQ